MKKFIFLFPFLLCTCACSTINDPLVCTIKEEAGEISTEITIKTEFEKGKAIHAKANAIMYFKDKEEAQAYYDAYTDDKANLTLEDNKIIIALEDQYDENGKERIEVKKTFENAGYTCK